MAQPPASKDWIDILSALFTPTIAIAAVAIGFLQWHLHRSELRYELFARRYGVFDKIKMFIKLNIKNPIAYLTHNAWNSFRKPKERASSSRRTLNSL